MIPREITVRVLRFRPGQSDPGRFEATRLRVHEATTVLEALETLRDRDPSLMFRHSCHHGSCGTCACRINGVERLACTTRVLALGTEVVSVEPLRKLDRTGDLVVDPAGFFREYPSNLETQRGSEWMPAARPPGEIEGFARLENCIECGACVSACPVEDFLGPALLAALNRERVNRPQREAELLELAGGERGAWRCERALECSRVCPTAVYPARHIAELRRACGRGRQPGK